MKKLKFEDYIATTPQQVIYDLITTGSAIYREPVKKLKDMKKKFIFTARDLKEGKEFTFSPDENTHFLDDDFREATVSFSERTGNFVVWFNGVVVHASKTFSSLERKLNQLIEDWKLTEVEETTVGD